MEYRTLCPSLETVLPNAERFRLLSCQLPCCGLFDYSTVCRCRHLFQACVDIDTICRRQNLYCACVEIRTMLLFQLLSKEKGRKYELNEEKISSL